MDPWQSDQYGTSDFMCPALLGLVKGLPHPRSRDEIRNDVSWYYVFTACTKYEDE